MPALIAARRLLTLSTGGVPANALLLNGQPVTLNGQYITLARAS